MRSIELTGRVDERGHLHLNEPLIALTPGEYPILLLIGQGMTSKEIYEALRRVPGRIVLLMAEESDMSDIDEEEWLRAAARNPAFDFLRGVQEDIYTVADGKPFHDQG